MIKETNDISYLNTLSSYKITLNAFSHILIYAKDNEILGFLDYSKMYENMEINYIYVKEEYRKKGVATELLNYMITNNNFNNITLEVNIKNLNAINLYKKFDFKIINIRKNYYNGVDGYLMERSNI